ncbi:RnfH family protein [Paralcaligenes sp. KSB-10]|jgi:putative ubiquitin-RnfH superfamily antitoxin RatB of RatAB toxin-antitoxin module|uniref:RnfH family protein n=1 Tax=Paralcaligenes sp. KSB-10 TaxID=2901142 RepID=UPI001E5EF4CE|nr:RnfH family protein [Paralcaligenes sp. KSB-10]UHL64872.1 RnfH family protein [Paralcaligenes sp. KSB-10]
MTEKSGMEGLETAPIPADSGQISIQIVYAEPHRIWQEDLRLPAGTTAAQALELSGFARHFPNFSSDVLAMGVYGEICVPERRLADGDRLEIYRALTFDPLESRRRRAVHRKAFMTKSKNRPKRRKAKLAAQARTEHLTAPDSADTKE